MSEVTRHEFDIMSTSRGMRWTGRVMSGLVALFLLFDAVMKLAKVEPVVSATAKLGYPESVIIPLGVVLALSTLGDLSPTASILGAILVAGYLGGAVATHVRVEDPLWTHTLFPVYLGILMWVGLVLRDARLRVLTPIRRVRWS